MSKILGLAASLVLLVAVPANAQSPTEDAYGGAAGVLGTVAEGSDYTPPVGTSKSVVPAPASSPASASTPAPTAGVAGESVSGGNGSAGSPSASAAPAAGVAGERAASAGDRSGSGQAFTTKPIATAGRLPFTGLDMGLLAAGSLLLVAIGFGLRRFGHSASQPV